MKKLALLGVAAVLAAPALAHAQSDCVRREQNNRVAGTVIGAGAGAAVGSAVAGRGNHTTGAVVGGVIGGVLGNQATRGSGCPEGYEPRAYPAADNQNQYRNDNQNQYRNEGPFWAGAPGGVRERMDFLEQRINNGERDGSLNRHEAHRAHRDLTSLRYDTDRMRRRDGGRLSPTDRDYVWNRLNGISQNIRWARHNDRRSY